MPRPPRRRLFTDPSSTTTSESSPARRIRVQRERRARLRAAAAVGPEATPQPQVSPSIQSDNRRRQNRHSSRRHRGLPSGTPSDDESTPTSLAGVGPPFVSVLPSALLSSTHHYLVNIAMSRPVLFENHFSLPATKFVLKDFNDACKKFVLSRCSVCNCSRIAHVGDFRDGVCRACVKHKRENDVYVLSGDNDMNPFIHGYPFHLPTLSIIEELLISRVFVVMNCYRLNSNGDYGYRGHCLNIQMDISKQLELCSVLPHLPCDLPVFVIRLKHRRTIGSGKEFKVNLLKIRRWLEFLKRNHPGYADVDVDFGRFSELSRDADGVGDIDLVDHVQQVVEVENDQLDVRDHAEDGLDTVNNEVDNGPEQGGATGEHMLDTVDDIERGHLFVNSDRLNQNYDDTIRDLVEKRYGSSSNPMIVNVNGSYLSDYSTPGLQALAFPTLFPYGVGDCTRISRSVNVSTTVAIKHYLHISVYNPTTNMNFYPFAKHLRWMHWGQNMAERHRYLGQRKVFLRRNTRFENMSEENLRNIVFNKSDEYNDLIRSMQVYNANIVGSNSYFYKRRKELEALMECKGMPTAWFTFSAADNHWHDLHKLIYSNDDVYYNNIAYNDLDELQKLRFRVNTIRDYQHIVDEFFFKRAKTFLEHYFSDRCLNVEYFWFRVEYQARGTAHIHGCYKLKSDPGIAKLAEVVMDGRIAARTLALQGYDCPYVFDVFRTEKDIWVSSEELLCHGCNFAHEIDPTVESPDELREKVKKGIEAERIVCNYNDFLFTTYNPCPPSDANSDQRDDSTKFKQNVDNTHPANIDPELFYAMDEDSHFAHYCQLVNTVQRHKCSNYCCNNKEKKCRFGFPLMLIERTHLQLTQYLAKTSDGLYAVRYRIECLSKRNDRWLNSHCKVALCSWMANMDMRIVVDVGKVVEYLTKYVTKTEKSLSKGMKYFIRNVVTKNLDDGQTALQTIKKVMNRLLGNRLISRQETCHLINNLPLVSCSHNFVLVNLLACNELLQLDDVVTDDADLAVGDDVDVGNSERSRVLSLIEIYSVRNNTIHWVNINEIPTNIESVNLANFVTTFRVGIRGANKNKIMKQTTKKYVPVFYPNFSSSGDDNCYVNYCKLFMTKYKPWIEVPSNSWGGVDTSDAEIYEAFNMFVANLVELGISIPDQVRREVEYYNQVDHAYIHNIDPVVNEIDNNGISLTQTSNDNDIQRVNRSLTESLESVGDDDIYLKWNEEHNWYSPVHNYEYDILYYTDIFKLFVNRAKDNLVLSEFKHVCRSQLSGNQIVAHDLCVRYCSNDQFEGGLMLMWGMGGAGKSFVVNCIRTTMYTNLNKNVFVTSTTGLTANAINGSTIHSALNLPVGRRKFVNLSPDALKKYQDKFKDINLLVIDEFSMLRARELHYVNKRLKQIKHNENDFGGMLVLLVGDPGQLPPVAGTAVWDDKNSNSELDTYGCMLFRNLIDVVHLDVNLRLDMSDSNALYFDSFLKRLRNGKVTTDDFNKISRTCCCHRMGEVAFREKGFYSNDITTIFSTNAECNRANLKILSSLNSPVLRVRSINTGEVLNQNTADMMGLSSEIFLCVGCKVMLTTNVCTQLGLSNGTVCVVEDFIFNRGDNSTVPGNLPAVIFLSVLNNSYTGPSLFPSDPTRSNWIPLTPNVNHYSTYKNGLKVVSTRTMYPLKLCYSWTAWKCQGQTLNGKVVCNLGDKEKEDGLSYVIFSRVRRLDQIGIIDGLTLDRLTRKISNRISFKKRVQFEEEVLNTRTERTKLKYSELFGPITSGHYDSIFC